MRADSCALRALLSEARAIAAGAMLAVLSLGSAAAQQAIVQPGYAVVTGYAGFVQTPAPAGADPTDYMTIDPNGISATVVDLTKLGPQGGLSTAPKPFSVTASQVGQVFGVALDDAAAPNIYLAATSAYGLSIATTDANGALVRVQTGTSGAQFVPGQFGPAALGGGPDSIWRVDGVTGAVTLLININTGTGGIAGLGALAFDPTTQQLFASDLGTGIVYRIGLDGTLRGTYDHGTEGRPSAGLTPLPAPAVSQMNIADSNFNSADPRTWNFAPPGREVYALAVHNRRLYYSVALGSQVWSAGIAASGSVSGARMEVDVPALGDGEEIASIAFDARGAMYIGERGPTTGDYTLTALAAQGQSRSLRFVPKPVGDSSPGLWRLAPDVYSVGMAPSYANADGGVALNYGYKADGTIDLAACQATLWSTGERLLDPGDGSTGFPTVDGIQGNATSVFQPQNMPPTAAWYVDYDDQPGNADFRGYMGAIATLPCPGAPALVCPTGSTNQNGVCVGPPPPPPAACRKPLIRYQSGTCGCPNANDVLSNDGKRCVPPACPPGTKRQGGQCVPVRCNPLTQDLYKGQCVAKCPAGQDHIGDGGRCVAKCPVGITKLPGCNPPKPCDRKANDIYKGQCVPKCPVGQIHAGDAGACVTPHKPDCDLRTHEYYKGQCVILCSPPERRQSSGACGLVFQPNGNIPSFCLPGTERVKGTCLPTCSLPAVRQRDGSCAMPFQTIPTGPVPPAGQIR